VHRVQEAFSQTPEVSELDRAGAQSLVRWPVPETA